MHIPSSELIAKLRAARTLLEHEGVEHMTLFGSRARGNARLDSDVDIALDVAADSRFSVLNLVGVEEIVTHATGLRANAFMHRALDSRFRSEIARDGLAVF